MSTIHNADRIAVIEGGRVCEVGTHDELMKNVLGTYCRLQMLQDIDTNHVIMTQLHETATSHAVTIAQDSRITSVSSKRENVFEELDKERVTKNAKRAWSMGAEDAGYFIVGAIGACMTGLIFPAWGTTCSMNVANSCSEITANTPGAFPFVVRERIHLCFHD